MIQNVNSVLVGRAKQFGHGLIVAWDGSSKAARAVAGALPFLRSAESVEIMSAVSVEIMSVHGEKGLSKDVSGAEIAPHLSRHQVPVTVKSVSAVGGDAAEALRREAESSGADMIIMGGFMHSRLREMVFGGVTQSLLRSSPVPLFMSH